MKKQFMMLVLCVLSWPLMSQKTVRGKVKDQNNEPIPGVNILEKGTSNGTTTDFNGDYSLNVNENAILVFSYVGFTSQEKTTSGTSTVNIVMVEGVSLDEVLLVGSRSAARSKTDTALPIDVLTPRELQQTGQTTFDKALQYRIPSFNTVQTPVNDATSLLDPYEIRNMGPSRTLILVNGKRKNLSALLYTQTSPGIGETGADISAIPTDAIKRVEILRDGASAQYGSDAIAGVMNIILKDNPEDGYVSLRGGITSKGDGESIGIAVNNGSSILDDKGFVNYTLDLSKTYLANRPGKVDAQGEFDTFSPPGTPLIAGENTLQDIQNYLSTYPDANNINGSPETTAAEFLINSDLHLSEHTKLYANVAYVYKKVNSFANYRTPYWKKLSEYPYLADFFPDGPIRNYIGYLPTFEGNLNDYNGTIGFKSEKNGWIFDLSYTTGGNKQTYNIQNSQNGSPVLSPSTWEDKNNNGTVDSGELSEGVGLYRENSPITFDPGGTKFTHNVGNIDISKKISEQISIAFGAEFRNEIFEVISGDLASYDGGGADSFAGNRPENSGKFDRYNLGGYLDVAFDITDDFLINGTLRAENYSDFGNTLVWKLSSRYKLLNDKLTLRGSVSTGFRAPTLHQIYTQKTQYTFEAGQGIQISGLINNVSPQAKLLGIPKLGAEKSINYTVGIGARVDSHLNMTFDFYQIDVDDRIVYSTKIRPSTSGNTSLDMILNSNNLTSIQFFVNALKTRTSGLDAVINYKGISAGKGTLGFNLAGNYTFENRRKGEVMNPELVENAGQSVVNSEQEALFFTSRPKTKWILGATYDLEKFSLSLNNTYFGKTTFRQDGLDSNLKTEFIPKIVSDFGATWNATDHFSVSANINNMFDVLPKWKFKALNAAGSALLSDPIAVKNQSNLITFNQRYSRMTYNGYHFSQLGTMYNVALKYTF